MPETSVLHPLELPSHDIGQNGLSQTVYALCGLAEGLVPHLLIKDHGGETVLIRFWKSPEFLNGLLKGYHGQGFVQS